MHFTKGTSKYLLVFSEVYYLSKSPSDVLMEIISLGPSVFLKMSQNTLKIVQHVKLPPICIARDKFFFTLVIYIGW